MNPVDKEQYEVFKRYLEQLRSRDPEAAHYLALGSRALDSSPPTVIPQGRHVGRWRRRSNRNQPRRSQD
jgi:hypothetical protein